MEKGLFFWQDIAIIITSDKTYNVIVYEVYYEQFSKTEFDHALRFL